VWKGSKPTRGVQKKKMEEGMELMKMKRRKKRKGLHPPPRLPEEEETEEVRSVQVVRKEGGGEGVERGRRLPLAKTL
jgi:hypothetical protein